jgi:hypothetical protein
MNMDLTPFAPTVVKCSGKIVQERIVWGRTVWKRIAQGRNDFRKNCCHEELNVEEMFREELTINPYSRGVSVSTSL